MVQAELVITNGIGLHARPCSMFVNLASRFRSEVFVTRDGVEVNGKSILGLMMLAAEPGAAIVVRAEGPDEDEALAALAKLVEENFGE
ncbi:MAG: HPr family phosphocarrier protein [Candidatus Eisenbacteria bacterium]